MALNLSFVELNGAIEELVTVLEVLVDFVELLHQILHVRCVWGSWGGRLQYVNVSFADAPMHHRPASQVV